MAPNRPVKFLCLNLFIAAGYERADLPMAKSSQVNIYFKYDTQAKYTEQSAIMHFSGQPALKVRLA